MLLAGVVLIWLAKVRPDVGKGRSEIVTDFLRAELLQDGQTATQVFTYDKDILTIGLEFYLPGDQPSGALDVVLYDADTGEELSRSVGTMDYIVPDQYTTLGMDPESITPLPHEGGGENAGGAYSNWVIWLENNALWAGCLLIAAVIGCMLIWRRHRKD